MARPYKGPYPFEQTKFRDLIDREYVAKGFCKERWLCKLLCDTGCSRSSLSAAYEGTRVKAETARRLGLWAATVHKVDLDMLDMLTTRTKATRAKPAC